MKLLDLFCGAGGAGMGYHQMGFEVEGVDTHPQPKYPFTFHLADALDFLYHHGHDYDLIHASPPCQAYTSASFHGKIHPDLLAETRQVLREVGTPYVIENVPGAPLENPVWLEGTVFGLKIYRRRGFECSFPVLQPAIPLRIHKQVKMGRPPKPDEFIQAVGHFSGVPLAREVMEIPWMGQKELAQAIPPAYTRFIAEQFLFLHHKEADSVTL